MARLGEHLDAVDRVPEELLQTLTKSADIALLSDLREIPMELRRQAVAEWRAQRQPGPQRPGEPDDVYNARVLGAEFGHALYELIALQCDSLKVGVTLDEKRNKIHADLALQATERSKLASVFADLSPRRSAFSDFLDNSVLIGLAINGQIQQPVLMDQLALRLEGSFDQLEESIAASQDLDRAARRPLSEAARATRNLVLGSIRQGIFDAGATYRIEGGALNVVAGFALGDCRDLRDKVSALSKAPVASGYGLDEVQVEHLTAYRLQDRLQGRFVPANTTRFFRGQMQTWIALSDSAVYVACGAAPKSLLATVLRKSREPQHKTSPAVQAMVSFGRSAEYTEPSHPLTVQMSKAFSAYVGDDYLRLIASGSPAGAFKLRFGVDLGVVRGLGDMISAYVPRQARSLE